MVEQVAKRSDASARRVFQIASVIFNHGVAKRLTTGNPCAAIKLNAVLGKHKLVREKISLDAEEIGAFLRSLPASGLRNELVLRILLATGTRKSELLNAHKADVDFDQNTWTVPAANAKNRRQFVIPLAPSVVEWFQRLIALAGASE